MKTASQLLLCIWLLAGHTMPAQAHPVPKGSHDRILTVRLTPEAVIVEYRLETDLWTVIYEDLPEVEKEGELGKLSSPKEFAETFARLYGPHLAAGLRASLDGQPLPFVCTGQKYEITDSLRCDFVFRAAWKPRPDAPQRLTFREANFTGKEGLFKPGKVNLALAAGPGVRQLRSRDETTLAPDERARTATAVFELGEPEQPSGAGAAPTSADEGDQARAASDSGLLRLFLDSKHGLWLLLLLSAAFGAAHALTPGHGKTLVAAYLVGERGTVRHAVFLGLVTTLTHTGAVLVLALVLRFVFPDGISAGERASIQRGLELGAGFLIAGLGFWLLLRRLSGQADHIHLPGMGHHHHHGHSHGGHSHGGGHFHSHPVQGGWWGLMVLGISGGIVPCWDAVALLLAAVAMNLLWWALPMLLAFSAGLACVLILIGILVVRTKAFAGKHWEQSRLFRALPLVSAALVACLGLWLCYKAVQGA